MTQAAEPLLFKGIRLFDGVAVSERRDVRVAGGVVAEVGTGLAAPAGTEVVDGAGATLLPGLIDAHVHAVEGSLEQALRFGVTTELDMFADEAKVSALRAEAARRLDVADLRSAGCGATTPGGHPCQLVGAGLFAEFPTVPTAQDAAAFVAERVARGCDYLKIFATGVPGEPELPELATEVLAALATAAEEHGLLSVAHATRWAAAITAVRNGVDGLAHLPFDRPIDASIVESLVETGAFVVPTLTVVDSFCQVNSGPALAADPAIGPYLDEQAAANLAEVMTPPPASGYLAGNAHTAVLPLHDAGVPVLVGTDALAPGTAHGASVHHELELLVAAGLTPLDALAAATSVPAEHFALRDRGRVLPGLRADLLLVRGDPTTTITDTRRIVAVYRAGTKLERKIQRP